MELELNEFWTRLDSQQVTGLQPLTHSNQPGDPEHHSHTQTVQSKQEQSVTEKGEDPNDVLLWMNQVSEKSH